MVRIEKIPILTVIFIALSIGCTRDLSTSEIPPPPPPAESLLFHIPFIGDETELRNPPPQTVRIILDQTSAEGWRIPSEEMLRFPVEIRGGARFSFHLGASTRIPIHVGDLNIQVEYLPEILPPAITGQPSDDKPIEPAEPIVLYKTTPIDTPKCFSQWHHVDMSLSAWAPGRGEIRFLTKGPISGDSGLDIIFGQPVIYHPPERHKKNILLIGVDTLRRDAITPYGASPDVTPNLQELSETSTIFTQARAQSSWTLPSFASMITGELPSTIGATVYTGHLPDYNITLGEMLLPEGYATATICSNTWLGNEQSGFHQGTEELWFHYNASAQDSVNKAKDFISRSRRRDWFCFLHFMDPHTPYAPSEKYVKQFCDPNYFGPYQNHVESVEQWKSGEVIPPMEDKEQAWNLYLGEVAEVDEALGDLVSFLEECGLIEETLIIFASDHGEEFFDHGGFEHGHTQFDELVWMPLIVRGVGFPPGERIDTNVGNTDITPTILQYLGLSWPGELAGRPLQDVIKGAYGNERLVFGEDNTRGTLRKFAVEWPYKCILDFVTGEIRLYDLEGDPGETENVNELYPEIAKRLSSEIVSAMLPRQTAFHCWITRSYQEPAHTFTGTLRVPGGIEDVIGFMLVDGDSYEFEGDTVTFRITSSQHVLGPNKHLMIIPSPGADTIEVSIRVDGRIDPDRFFPYGSSQLPEVTGSTTVHIDEYPLGHDLPWAIEQCPARCYIWGVKGYEREGDRVELDEQTLEQLRSLGYI